jgi:hypothetical protein
MQPGAAVLDEAANQADRQPVSDRDDLQRGGVQKPLPPACLAAVGPLRRRAVVEAALGDRPSLDPTVRGASPVPQLRLP